MTDFSELMHRTASYMADLAPNDFDSDSMAAVFVELGINKPVGDPNWLQRNTHRLIDIAAQHQAQKRAASVPQWTREFGADYDVPDG